MNIQVLSPYDTWVLANSIRIHFRGKSQVTGMLYKTFPVEKFERVPERFVCRRLSDKYQTKRNIAIYIASNLVFDPNIWFHGLESEECRARYLEARKNLDAPVNCIQTLMRETSISEIVNGKPIPLFVSGLMSGKFSPEQICILDTVTPFINRAAEENDNVVVHSMTERLAKYKFFCTLQDVTIRNTIINLIENSKGV